MHGQDKWRVHSAAELTYGSVIDLPALLAPRSIALVGASEASSWSLALVTNFANLGFQGRLHLVNPRHSQQLGLPCHGSVSAIPDQVDCAYVMTGTEAASEVVEDCGRKGVRSIVMLTAGFKEVGPEGAERERALVERCRELGITLLGPNCLGFVNYRERIPAYGLLLTGPFLAGGIAIASQSGGMLLPFHRLAMSRGIGLAVSVSIGNEGMCTASDFLADFVRRDDVKVVGALLEGIRDPAGFLRAAELAREAQKPLVILKVGRSQASHRATVAHTGSLAGADAVMDAVFRQHSIVRVDSPEELIETCALLATSGWPPGGRTAVVSTSGGASSLIPDLAIGTRVEIPDFAPSTKARLAAILPSFGHPQNPLDTTGVIVNQPKLLALCAEAVAAEHGFDALLINTDAPRDPGANPAGIEERVASLAEVVHNAPLFTAVSATTSNELTPFGMETLARHRLHFANGLALGVQALDHAIFYGQAIARRRPALSRRRRPVPTFLSHHTGVLAESPAKRLLAAYGLTGPPERLTHAPEEAAAAAAAIGFPVVVKVVSVDIPHKTEVGGVKLGVRTPDEVREAYEQVSHCSPGARVEGVLVACQIFPIAELIVGVKQDDHFGPVVVLGLGGIFAEAIHDVSIRLPPIDEETAREMLSELRGVDVLRGARGRPVADLAAVSRVLVGLSDLALDLGERLAELDVNPLFALPDGALAGDALVVLR
jgi:acyl-CoA synthetase (NDP forming)